jgi:hypothetical protein
MGGLVMRAFCGQGTKRENGKKVGGLDACRETVRKLITLDTPHRGSHLADVLLAYRDYPAKFPNPESTIPSFGLLPNCHERIDIFRDGSPEEEDSSPHPIGSAVDAMAVSHFPDSLIPFKIPPFLVGKWNNLPNVGAVGPAVHAIFGTGLEVAKNSDIQTLWGSVFGVVGFCGFTPEDVFGHPTYHDWIVSGESQKGGLFGNHISSFVEDHASILESPKVVDRVRELLDASLEDEFAH